jgi:hypothetical protein
MIYVASPYTHDSLAVREHRYLLAESYVLSALREGFAAFSPIYYCHKLAVKFDLPGNANFWKKFNNNMMRRADYVHVLQLVGWRESRGVQYELMMAQELGIPIIYVEFHNENFPQV